MFYPVNGDPYWNNVSLLLPMTGANNGTTFTDVSPTPKTITRYNAITSTTQSKWGEGSGYFDGTGDYLSIPDSVFTNLASAPFTIECWVYISGVHTVTYGYPIVSKSKNSGGGEQLFYISGSMKLCFYRNTAMGELGVWGSTTLSQNSWYHVALSVNGSTWRLFVNGILDGSTNSSTFFAISGTQTGEIGRNIVLSYPQYSDCINGYINDLRITQGIARYTAEFVVPDGPLPYRLPELPVRSIIQPNAFHQIARLGL